MCQLIYRLRKAVYEFARDFIKPDPPERAEVPEVGHICFDEAKTWGKYSGDVVMPAGTELTDATAFSLVMSAMWLINQGPREGLHGRLSHEGFRHHIRWSVEFEPLDESIKGEVIPMDPAGIRRLLYAMVEAGGIEYQDDDTEEASAPGGAISMEDARNRLRKSGDDDG